MIVFWHVTDTVSVLALLQVKAVKDTLLCIKKSSMGLGLAHTQEHAQLRAARNMLPCVLILASVHI